MEQTHTLRAGRGRAAVCALGTQVQEAKFLATHSASVKFVVINCCKCPFAGNEQMAGALENKQGSVLDTSRTQQTSLLLLCFLHRPAIYSQGRDYYLHADHSQNSPLV